MKTVVLYHASCADGFCSAWVARGVLKGDVEFIPVQYGQNPPGAAKDKDVRLYVLDFCYPRDVMVQLADGRAADMVVLDHHKTAQEALTGFAADYPNVLVKFDMDKSGGRLAWEHFYATAGMPVPWLVDYTEDRDLWRWELPNSWEVNAAVRSYPFDFDIWNALHASDRATLVKEGAGILRAEAQTVAAHVRNASEIELAGDRVLCVNATTLISEIAGELAKGRPFGVCFFVRADGKRVYSLRSAPDGRDVAEIAKSFGGGGHTHAAGYIDGSS